MVYGPIARCWGRTVPDQIRYTSMSPLPLITSGNGWFGGNGCPRNFGFAIVGSTVDIYGGPLYREEKRETIHLRFDHRGPSSFSPPPGKPGTSNNQTPAPASQAAESCQEGTRRAQDRPGGIASRGLLFMKLRPGKLQHDSRAGGAAASLDQLHRSPPPPCTVPAPVSPSETGMCSGLFAVTQWVLICARLSSATSVSVGPSGVFGARRSKRGKFLQIHRAPKRIGIFLIRQRPEYGG